MICLKCKKYKPDDGELYCPDCKPKLLKGGRKQYVCSSCGEKFISSTERRECYNCSAKKGRKTRKENGFAPKITPRKKRGDNLSEFDRWCLGRYGFIPKLGTRAYEDMKEAKENKYY